MKAFDQLLEPDRDEWPIKEIEKKIPWSEGWLRHFEQRYKYIKFDSPRHPKVRRLFNRAEVLNVLWLAALRQVGFSPKRLEYYKQVVRRFRDRAAPFFKRRFKRKDDDLERLFHLADLFPEGDTEAMDWDKLNVDDPDAQAALEDLLMVYYDAVDLIQRARQTKKLMDSLEKQLNENFLSKLSRGLRHTAAGATALQYYDEILKKK